MQQSLILDNFTLIRGRYRIIRLLAKGGEGYIYLTQDTLNNNQIAVMKQMYFGPSELQGIELDYQIFSGLMHPSIVQVLDFFWEDEIFFIVMNFVAGETMRDFLRRQTSPVEEIKVLNWALKLCHVLRFLHARATPIFHADIAPDNIVITPNHELVLIDFGIARVGFEAVGLREGYSAPEQINGTLDESCDVFSVGATMYKCLTLKDPTEPDMDPRKENPKVSPRVADLIKRATGKSKSMLFGLIPMRYKNMDEFIQGIHQSFIGAKV